MSHRRRVFLIVVFALAWSSGVVAVALANVRLY